MTTRRTILQGLAALPVAAIPAVIPDRMAEAFSASPDAALIAIARRTCVLARLEEQAVWRRSEAEDRYAVVEPPPPRR